MSVVTALHAIRHSGDAGRIDSRPHSGPALALSVIAALLSAGHLVVRYNGPGWTSPLILADHLFDLGFALAILWLALALGRRVAAPLLGLSDHPLSENLSALALGLGLLSLCILGAGFARLYYGPVFIGAALALILWLRQELLALAHDGWKALRAWSRNGYATAPSAGQRIILIVLVLALALLWIEATLPVGTGSVLDWDAPAYHISAPKLYIAAHRLLPVPDIPLANAPSGIEMFYIPGLLAGSETLGKSLNLICMVLLALSTYAMGRRHVGSAAGWLAMFLLCLVEWLVAEVPATLNDLGAAFALVLSVSDLFAWLHGAIAPTASATARWPGVPKPSLLLVRSGLLAGVAISFKLVNIAILPAATIVIVAACLPLLARNPRAGIELAVRGGLAFGISALAVLSPWLLKNLYFFHQALYPATIASSAGSTQSVQATQNSHLQWVATHLVDVFWHAVGPLSACLLLAPLLLPRRTAIVALGTLFAIIVLWLWYVPLYAEPRYYLGPIAVAEVFTAACALALLARLPLRPALRELPLLFYLFVGSLVILLLAQQQTTRSRAAEVAYGATSSRAYLTKNVAPYAADTWVNLHTPPGAEIAMVHTTLGYYLDRPYLNDWYGARLRRLEGDQPTRLAELALWCRAGVRYAIVNRGDDHDLAFGGPITVSLRWLRDPNLNARRLFSHANVDVFALNPCNAGAGKAL